MNIDTWIFLISRNQYLDYRTIAAPDFICQDSSAHILSKSADAELVGDENVAYREICNYRLGEITLIYRVLKATAKDIGSDNSEEVLRDSYGREISLIEGVIIKGFQPDIKLPANLFETVHQQTMEAYKKFWECSTPQPASPTPVLTVETSNTKASLSLKRVKSYTAKGSLSSVTVQQQTWHCIHSQSTFDSINSVVFHPKSPKYLAVRCKQIVQVWDLSDLKHLDISFDYEGASILFGGSTCSISFSPDGQLLATGMIEVGDLNRVKLWNWQTKKLWKDFSGHSRATNGRIFDLSFSPDCYFLASCSQDGVVKLWDIKSGGELQLNSPISRHGIPVHAIAFSPNGNFLVTGDKEGGIKIWNPRSGQEIETVGIKGCTGQVKSIAFSPDSQLLASGDTTGSIKIWNLKDGREVRHIPAHKLPIQSISFSPDGKTLASGSDDHDIKLWDVETGNQVATLSGHSDVVNSVAFSHDGKMIASGSDDSKEGVKIWQIS
jgi:WD40 repeat protein